MGKLSDFLKSVNDWIGKHEVIDSPTVTWERSAAGLLAHTSLTPLGGVGSGDYEGPFNVIQKDDTSVTVGTDSTNLIILGLVSYSFTEADLTVSASGYACLKITYSIGYTYALEFSASLPTQTATNFYIPLAYVTVADGAISAIEQLQFGAIVQSGRVL